MTTPRPAGSPRTVVSRLIFAGALAGAIGFLSACNDTTGPEGARADTAAPQLLRAQMFDGAGMPSLVRRAREAIRSGGHPEGEALLQRAGELRREARKAMGDRDRDAARTLLAESRDATLSAVVTVLGSSAVEDAIASRERMVQRMSDRVRENSAHPEVAERMQARLSRTEEGLAQAKELLTAGDAEGALRALDVMPRMRGSGMRGEGMRESGMREHRMRGEGTRQDGPRAEMRREDIRGGHMHDGARREEMRQRMREGVRDGETRMQHRERMREWRKERDGARSREGRSGHRFSPGNG